MGSVGQRDAKFPAVNVGGLKKRLPSGPGPTGTSRPIYDDSNEISDLFYIGLYIRIELVSSFKVFPALLISAISLNMMAIITKKIQLRAKQTARLHISLCK